MSYQFPKRVLRTGDVLNPRDLTEDFAPAADLVSGKLNAHNFNQTLGSPSVTVDRRAFYSVDGVLTTPVPFHWTGSTPGAFGYPDDTTIDAGMFQLQNNFEWQALNTSVLDFSVALTTGTAVLWINAYVQYLWFGFNPAWGTWSQNVLTNQHRNYASQSPVNLQFALRVNGNVVEETITGIDDITYRASVPIKPEDPSAYAGLPGPQDLLGRQISSLGPACLPVRLGACVPVQPGDQLVEVVCRRVPFTDRAYGSFFPGYGQYDVVFMYSRQIHVTELKMFPVDSVTSVEVSAPAFSDEAPLSQATLYTQRLQPIVSAYNSIDVGSVQRGALTHSQVPSTLLDSATTEQLYATDAGPIFNNYFPGHNDDTVTTTGFSGAPGTGWKLITDASNNNSVRITGFTVTDKCQILVLANLRVRNILALLEQTSGDETLYAGNFAAFALFKLMWQYSGSGPTTWNGVEASTGMVNNFVWWPRYDVNSSPIGAVTGPNLQAGIENVEVALMAVLDFTATAPTGPINLGVFGSVANDGTNYQISAGNIIALAYR
jgi:hypothetical protein